MSAFSNFVKSLSTKTKSAPLPWTAGTPAKPVATGNSQNSSVLSPSSIGPASAPAATSPAPVAVTTPTKSPALTTPAAQNYMTSVGAGTGTPTPSTGLNTGLAGGASTPTPTTPTTPPAPTAPSSYDTAKASYTTAYKDYITSLAPSAETTAAKTKYNDFVTNAKLGINNIEGQGRGIPLALVRGQQEKLGNQAEIEANRLQGDIDIATGGDTALREGKLAGVNLEKDLLGLEKNPNDPKDLPASVQEYEYAKKNGYTGTFTDYQNDDANRKKVVAGLTPGQVNSSVNQIAGNFDNEQVVKDYNVVASTIKGLENAGASPTDDIQRIYAFAKIMDPNSAVREGEYKTIQDYSTALLQRIGINIQRAFDARGFLTEDARKAMQTTLNNILKSKEQSYKALQAQYQRQIDDAYAGKNRTITDYSAGYGSGSGTGSGSSASSSGPLTWDSL